MAVATGSGPVITDKITFKTGQGPVPFGWDVAWWDHDAGVADDGNPNYLVVVVRGSFFVLIDVSLFSLDTTTRKELNIDLNSPPSGVQIIAPSSYVFYTVITGNIQGDNAGATGTEDADTELILTGYDTTGSQYVLITYNGEDAAPTSGSPDPAYVIPLNLNVEPVNMAVGNIDQSSGVGKDSTVYDEVVVVSLNVNFADWFLGYEWGASGTPAADQLNLGNPTNGGLAIAVLQSAADSIPDLLVGVMGLSGGNVAIFQGGAGAGGAFDENSDSWLYDNGADDSRWMGASIVVFEYGGVKRVLLGDPAYMGNSLGSSPYEVGCIAYVANDPNGVLDTGLNYDFSADPHFAGTAITSGNPQYFPTFWGVSSAVGDFNNDGYNDLVIGEPFIDGFNGRILIYWGKDNSIDISSPTDLKGGTSGADTYLWVGFKVCKGDFNGDGKEDLAVASYGTVLILQNSGTWADGYIHSYVVQKVSGTLLGVGDLDGDGCDDLIVEETVNASGNDYSFAYIYWGAPYAAFSDTYKTGIQAENILSTGSSEDRWDGAIVGDFNGDGRNDLVLYMDGYGTSDVGKIYILNGKNIDKGESSTVTDSTTFGYIWYIEGVVDANGPLGLPVLFMADIDEDGREDIVAGDPSYDPSAGADPSQDNTGRVVVFLGRAFPDSANTSITTIDLQKVGSSGYQYFGEVLGVFKGLDPVAPNTVYIVTGDATNASTMAGRWVVLKKGSGDTLEEVTSFDGSWEAGDYGRNRYSVINAGDITQDGWIDLLAFDFGWQQETFGTNSCKIKTGRLHVFCRPNDIMGLSWAGVSGFESDGVEYSVSEGLADFTFKVKYFDPDNEAPSYVKLKFDLDDDGTFEADEIFVMSKEDASDDYYPDGVIYKLELHDISVPEDGTMLYRFEATNSHETTVYKLPADAPAEVVVLSYSTSEIQPGGKIKGVVLTNNRVKAGDSAALHIDTAGKTKRVVIKVYDVSGALVKEVASEEVSGHKIYEISSEGLRAGIYLIYIEVGSEKEIRYMAVVK